MAPNFSPHFSNRPRHSNKHCMWLCMKHVTKIDKFVVKQDIVQANSASVQCCLYLSSFLKYLTCNFNDLELRHFKVIQSQRSWCQSIAHGWLPFRLQFTPTLYLSPFWTIWRVIFNDLELVQFKVIQGQRSLCKSIAQGRFHIRLPLTPSWYLSPFSRYLTLKLFFHGMQA